MTKHHYWNLPGKRRGMTSPQTTLRLNENFKKALGIFTEQESQRIGAKVSIATVLQDLTLTPSTSSGRAAVFLDRKRRQLAEIVEQLNIEEKQREQNNTHHPQPSDTA